MWRISKPPAEKLPRHSPIRRRRQKVMEHFSELKESLQRWPISQQNLLINICETYNLDLLSKSHFQSFYLRGFVKVVVQLYAAS